MKTYTVYRLTLKNDGRNYIGCTSQNLKRRFAKGTRYGGKMEKAIKEYGWESFVHTIEAENLTEEEGWKLEQELIKKYKTTNIEFGFNSSVGGKSSGLGCIRSEEAKIKTAQKTRGKKRNKEFCEKVRQRMSGRVVSEETKEKLRKANLGKHHSEETKKKISEINKGKNYGRVWKPSKEYCEAMSKIMMGHKVSKETREKLKLVNAKKVKCVETDTIYPSAREAERQTGTNYKLISMCCRGKCKTVYKQHWEFVAD